MSVFAESTVEEALLEWAGGLEYAVLNGPDIAPGEPAEERASYADVLLVGRLKAALAKLNPKIPAEALDDAFRKVTHTETPNLFENNRRFHRMLIDGIDVEYHADGRIVHDKVWLVDFDHPEENDWLAVNQYTVTEDKRTRRPDVVLFVNGLPLGRRRTQERRRRERHDPQGIPATPDLQARTPHPHDVQRRVGRQRRPHRPRRNADSRLGTVHALADDRRRENRARRACPNSTCSSRACSTMHGFLDLVRHFIVFEVDGDKIAKKMAGYHQFHAVNKAVDCTLDAVSPKGDRRVGVVWHTQGSGKSLHDGVLFREDHPPSEDEEPDAHRHHGPQ